MMIEHKTTEMNYLRQMNTHTHTHTHTHNYIKGDDSYMKKDIFRLHRHYHPRNLTEH